MVLTTAQFRFYGNLRRFIDSRYQNRTFPYTVKGHPSIKDTLEALGVPHTQINFVFADGRPVDFSYHLKGGEKIGVYPPGYPLKIRKKGKGLAGNPTGHGAPRFVVDSHLGKLVRHLRLLGFDSVYKNIFPDSQIIQISVSENRIVLSRDIGLLKNKVVRYGYFLHSVDPMRQVREVFNRYRLYSRIRPFTLCLECNGRIVRVAKCSVSHLLPLQVQKYYNRFYRCTCCNKVYWKGSHYDKMVKFIRHMKIMKGTR